MKRSTRYDYPHQENVVDHFAAGWIMAAALLAFSALVACAMQFFFE